MKGRMEEGSTVTRRRRVVYEIGRDCDGMLVKCKMMDFRRRLGFVFDRIEWVLSRVCFCNGLGSGMICLL